MEDLHRVMAINESMRRHFIEDKTGLVTLEESNRMTVHYDISDIDGAYLIPKNYKNGTFISQDEYNDKLKKYQIIKKILDNVNATSKNASKIILCGGAALWGIISEPGSNEVPNDFDLFMHGGTTEERDIVIDKIINILYEEFNILYIHQVNGVITIETTKDTKDEIPFKVQIILRDYFSISEILHSFDIPCCAVAWDGTTTYMTAFSQWSNLNKIIVVMPKYRSHTYELRIMKYFNKGYALLLPHLALPSSLELSNNKIILSKIEFELISVIDNMAIATVNIISFNNINIKLPMRDAIDYDTISWKNYFSIKLQNNKAPTLTEIDKYWLDIPIEYKRNCYYIIAKNSFIDRHVVITKNNINTHHITTKVKLKVLIPMIYYTQWIDNQIEKVIIHSDIVSINEELLQSIIGDKYEQFAIDSNLEGIKRDLSILNDILQNVKNITIYMLPDLKKNIIKYLMDIYHSKSDDLYNFEIPINRSIELTGSLRPCGQSDEEWYGKYFTKEKMPQRYDTIQDFLNTIKSSCGQKICSICLCEIDPLDPNTIDLICGHPYHYHKTDLCIGVYNWLRPQYKHQQLVKIPNCPYCRKKFPKKDERIPIEN